MILWPMSGNASQLGVGYKYEKSFVSMLCFIVFDSPIDNGDLHEYTVRTPPMYSLS